MKILAADDDDISRMLIVAIINESAKQHEVIAVENGRLAWEALEKNPDIGLGIFDLMMPEMGGLELLTRVRSDRRFSALPVLLCTSLSDRSTVEEAKALNVQQYIVKPFTRAGVLERLNAAIKYNAGASGLDVEGVCARLQIPKKTYLELVQRVAENSCKWAIETREIIRKDGARALAVRANGLKGAALNLGLGELGGRLAATENLLGQVGSRNPTLVAEQFLDIASVSDLKELAASIELEAKRLLSAIDSVKA